MVAGVGVLSNQIVLFGITPFTLLLHLVVGIAVSAWVINLNLKIAPDRKPVLAIGVVVALGSIWNSVQQWLGYLQTGLANDIVLVVGVMVMDLAGGCVSYTLFHLNILRK